MMTASFSMVLLRTKIQGKRNKVSVIKAMTNRNSWKTQ